MNTIVTVKIAGKSLQGVQFHGVRISQQLFFSNDIRLEIGFQGKLAGDLYKKATNEWLGDILDITIEDKIDSSIKALYKAIITRVELLQHSVILYAMSEDFLLGFEKKYQSFADKDGNALSKELTQSLKARKIISSPKTIPYKYFQQNSESDFDALCRIARYDGMLFFFDGENFVYDALLNGTNTIQLQLDNISDLSLNCQLGFTKAEGYPYNFAKHTMPSDFHTESTPYSPPSHTLLQNTYARAKKFNLKRQTFHATVINKKEFEKVLHYDQAAAAGSMAVLSARINHPSVKIGMAIQCADAPLLQQTMVVTELNAVFEGNEYYALIKAVPQKSYLQPPYADTFEKNGFPQHAVVVDNKDPESLGRVQIEYKWKTGYGASAQNPWARIVHTGAGKTKNGIQYGTHYIPRIGDHVLVACENGDPSQPIIIGALYHSESKPDVKTSNGSEEVLLVRTPQQSTIRVLDKQGEEEIIIAMRDNKNIIRLELKQPKITVESIDGTIHVHSKTIELHADETIEMKAKNIRMETRQDLTTTSKGNQKHSITGNSEKNVQGNDTEKVQGNKTSESMGNHSLKSQTNVEVKAGAAMTVSGTAAVKIESAMIQSSASATNIIKGAMVMIN
ncbi:MAG TPA: phage baseplate assembly protein V [Candidatus Kapabacteria bacterium]|jgi:type VI secretion system secreted protein VgrG|nr:phage baseplate assembly protein V [Candidatus Kapabacteria bacterium]